MKKLILISGTMGVGKTAVTAELNRMLDRSVMLDGDWCWAMDPFVVTEVTKAMVTGNIVHLLRSFLCCDAFDHVLFCWVMHEQAIADDLLQHLGDLSFRLYHYTLTCTPAALSQRLQRDIDRGLRTADIIPRSLARLALYDAVDSVKIDVSEASPRRTAADVARHIAANP